MDESVGNALAKHWLRVFPLQGKMGKESTVFLLCLLLMPQLFCMFLI